MGEGPRTWWGHGAVRPRWAARLRMRGSGRRTDSARHSARPAGPAEIRHRHRSRDARRTCAPTSTTVPPTRRRLTVGSRPASAQASAVRSACARLVSTSERAARAQPGRRARGHDPSLHVEPVGAAVEGDPVLVVARLAAASVAISSVGTYGALTSEHVDPPAQVVGQGVVQVALVDPPGRQVTARAGDGSRVGVGGVQLGLGPARGQRLRRAPRCRSRGRPRPARVGRPGPRRVDQELAASCAGRTRPGRRRCAGRRTPPSPTICSSGSPAIRRRRPGHQLAGDEASVEQQARLLLGEHTARRAQRGDELGTRWSATRPARAARPAAGSRSTDRSVQRVARRRPRSRPGRPRRARRSSPSHSRARQRGGAEGVLGGHAVGRELGHLVGDAAVAAARRRRRCRRRSRRRPRRPP